MATFYAFGKSLVKFVRFNCIRWTVLHRERTDVPGGYILACSHLSHLEPCLVGSIVDRRIDWMLRVEFYRYRIFASMLDALDAFPVNRQGVPVSAIRTAIDRVRRGRIVGIFPEGGVVALGPDSVLRGGPIKKGACVVAYRSAAPVLPVVVVGTEKLNRVSPWLPFRRARVWMIFGHLIQPPLHESRRRIARELMAQEIQREFQSLYQELCATCGLDESGMG